MRWARWPMPEIPAAMTDSELLTAAIATSGLNPSTFWRAVLGQPDASAVYHRTSGRRPLNPEARVICMLVVAEPSALPMIMGAVNATASAAV